MIDNLIFDLWPLRHSRRPLRLSQRCRRFCWLELTQLRR